MPEAPAFPPLTRYPEEKSRFRSGFAIAIGIHFFSAVLVCVILYLLGIVSLRELLEKGGAIAQSGPAPLPQIIELKLDDILPPPTDHIEFVKQILKEKPPVIPPPPKPEVKPKEVVKTQPKYTAPKATGAGVSQAVSAFQLGTSGFPAPSYPQDLLQQNIGGTVRLHVSFDGGGGIASADITGSSGVTKLDSWTRNFIFGHWKNASMAGRSVEVPIVYDPSRRSVH